MKNVLPWLVLAMTGTVFVACDLEKKGKSLGAPAIEPPVAEATPGALKIDATSLHLTEEITEDSQCTNDVDCQKKRALVRLVNRIFKGKEGCNDNAPKEMQGRIRCNLFTIDSRLASLDNRAKDSKRKCVGESAKDHTISFPAGLTRTMKLQCGNNLGGRDGYTLDLGFGFADGVFHVAEVQSSGRLIYGTVNQVSGDVELLMGGSKKIDSQATRDSGDSVPGTAADNGKNALSMLHIKANKNNESFEIAVGSNYRLGTGVGCGVRLKSNGTHIYATGIFAEPTTNTLETDCASTDTNVAESTFSFCLDAETLGTAADSNCANLKTFGVADIKPSSFTQAHHDTFKDNSFKDKVTDFDKSE